jgi:pimeloyl-ACP methyl ester carboxylesterase
LSQRIEIDGVTFAYEESGGNGPAVMFLHGLGGSANGWLAQLAACHDRGWRGIAPDQLGAGRSDAPPGRYSVERWARDAERLLDALGVERAALVGHSVGCMIAAGAAQRLGARAWALALCGGMARWPQAYAQTFAERVRLAREGRMDLNAEAVATSGLSERCRRSDPRLEGLLREAVASNPGERYARWAEATAQGRIEGLEALGCPLLAICGSEDPVTPPDAARELAAAAPQGAVELIEGAAHWCMIEAPEELTSALFRFLERHAPTPGSGLG